MCRVSVLGRYRCYKNIIDFLVSKSPSHPRTMICGREGIIHPRFLLLCSTDGHAAAVGIGKAPSSLAPVSRSLIKPSEENIGFLDLDFAWTIRMDAPTSPGLFGFLC